MSQSPQSVIEQAWDNRANLSAGDISSEIRNAVSAVIDGLNRGRIRVAERRSVGQWEVNQWVKKAVLLSFRLEDNKVMPAGGFTQFYDKVPSKFENWTEADFIEGGFRVVPPAIARRGSFIGKNAVLMPSYVNIGAYVGEGTMVDTWATVGSCAQIGKNVHLSGGVGKHQNLRSRNRSNSLWSSACRFSGSAWVTALCRRKIQPLRRDHCQESRRSNPSKNRHQRALARLI